MKKNIIGQILRLNLDYLKKTIDANYLYNEIKNILLDYDNIDNLEIVNHTYALFGSVIAPLYIELFIDYPQILDFIEDINLKLEFIEKYCPPEDLIKYETVLLKYEWDSYTGVGKKEQEEMRWITHLLQSILYDMKLWAREDGKSTNIEYLSEGSFFQVYKIGNEVLKIGERKHIANNNFSYNYLVAHFSREFSENYTIEICPYTITCNFNDNEVQQLYDDERNLGYCWADCKKDNIGLLNGDNLPRYINLNPLGYQFLGIDKENKNHKIANQIVIIDRDFSYDLNEYNIDYVIYKGCGGSWAAVCEKEYQKKLKK